MAEYVYTKEQSVKTGEPIIFKNETESSFSVNLGIIFQTDGEYHVSVHDKKIIVCNEMVKVESEDKE